MLQSFTRFLSAVKSISLLWIPRVSFCIFFKINNTLFFLSFGLICPLSLLCSSVSSLIYVLFSLSLGLQRCWRLLRRWQFYWSVKCSGLKTITITRTNVCDGEIRHATGGRGGEKQDISLKFKVTFKQLFEVNFWVFWISRKTTRWTRRNNPHRRLHAVWFCNLNLNKVYLNKEYPRDVWVLKETRWSLD